MPSRGRYELANAAKGRRIAAELEIADTAASRMRGLMFREEIVPVLFVFGSSGIFPIHSYFVKGEFDAVYLAGDGRVNEVYRRVAPNTALVSPKKSSAYLLELPPGMTDALCIAEGDVLEWERDCGRRLGGGQRLCIAEGGVLKWERKGAGKG